MILKPPSSRLVHVYGPVPSRRLGRSLGVDILPFKSCSFNCLYCQLGRSQKQIIRRRTFFDRREILSQIQRAIASGNPIDFITFSGSGEPTLSLEIGPLIREIKAATGIPVAVLTNSSLLKYKSVRRALDAADLVVPSLDAADAKTFMTICRPHASLTFEQVRDGLIRFCREYQGCVWLEIMLLKGINDSPDQLNKLRDLARMLNPEKIQLNTAVRPPADTSAKALTRKEMEKIRAIFGPTAEIIGEAKVDRNIPAGKSQREKILAMAGRRPVTLEDIRSSLGLSGETALKVLHDLEKSGRIKIIRHGTSRFYAAKNHKQK